MNKFYLTKADQEGLRSIIITDSSRTVLDTIPNVVFLPNAIRILEADNRSIYYQKGDKVIFGPPIQEEKNTRDLYLIYNLMGLIKYSAWNSDFNGSRAVSRELYKRAIIENINLIGGNYYEKN